MSSTASGREFFAYTFSPTRKVLLDIMRISQFMSMRFYKKHENETINFLHSIYKETDFLLQPCEAYFLYQFAKMQACLQGDFAEVGVYKGGSTKILCKVKKGKSLFGFDTFEGLPAPSTSDASVLREHQFQSELEKVNSYLSTFPQVYLIKGYFPQSASIIEDRKFSLVHLDVDIYESIKAGLTFFWDRLVNRGAIVVHDTHFEGVRRAIDEFLQSHSSCLSFYPTGTQWVLFK
jgi:hypothetical protein